MSHTFEVTPTGKELAGIKAIMGRKDEAEAIAELVALPGNQRLVRFPFSRGGHGGSSIAGVITVITHY